MNKRLVLLPLLGGFLLSGCTFTLFGKTIKLFEKDNKEQKEENKDSGDNKGGEQQQEETSGGHLNDSELLMDFTDSSWKNDRVFPYVGSDAPELLSFEFAGLEFNDVGCYASSYNEEYYVMMKNKYGDSNSPTYFKDQPAFISNKTALPKPIKKVELTINGGSSSGNTVYRVAIGTSEFTSAATEGGATGKKGQTISTTSTDSSAFYFSVSTNVDNDKIYNGQILKVKVSF